MRSSQVAWFMLFKYLESFRANEAVLRGDNEAGTELINPTNDHQCTLR